jgi:tol-pal system protein YbgF
MRHAGLVCGFLSLTLLAACSAMTGDNDELTRRVDYLRQDVEALTKQQKVLTDEIQRLQGVSGTPGQETTSPAPAVAPARTQTEAENPAVEVQNLASDSSAIYKSGLDLMGEGKYTEAQGAFADFIRKFPQSDLADNAQYWIGECFYSQKNFKEAEVAFKSVRDHFPFGNKVPDAIYKEALCQRQMGEEEKAKATLKQLVADYPDSEAAAKVKDKP